MALSDLLKVTLLKTRSYWSSRSAISRLIFLRRRAAFGLRETTKDAVEQTTTLGGLAWATKSSLVLSVFVAIALQATNKYAPDIPLIEIEKEAYSTFLATVAATGGVLIGLYYAATTAIAGAIYSQVPNNVRNLFARERIGNVYLRFLALLTFTSLILLAFQASGFGLIKVVPLLLTGFAGIAVIGFGILGVRAFNLFDPTTLSEELVSRIFKAIERCTPGHYQWLEPAFQNHARIVAREALDAINTLAQLSEIGKQLNGQPFVTFCRYQISLIVAYTRLKKKIPIDSKWYPVQYEYNDWYWTEDSTTTLLYQTAGRQPAKEVTDQEWIEKEILEIVRRCIRVNAAEGRLLLSVEIINALTLFTTALCREHEVERAVDVVQEVGLKCASVFFNPIADQQKREPIEQIAAADALASLLIDIYLSYREAAIGFRRSDLEQKISALHWRSKGEIYESGFPQFAFERLEYLRPRIQFERKSEGVRITPDWYVSETVRQSAVENAKKTIGILVDRIPRLLKAWADYAAQQKLEWVRAVLLAREAEYCSKLKASFADIRSRWEEFNEDKRIEGMVWARIDQKALDEKWIQLEKVLIQDMAQSAIMLGQTRRPKDFPDLAGQFLHTVEERCLEACIQNDSTTVEAIFPALFDGCLTQYSRLITRKKFQGWRQATVTKVAVAPLLDLMDLTGYCVLFGERFQNPELAKLVLDTWDKYLSDKRDSGVEIIKFLAAAISISEGALEIAHRSLVRTNWKLRVGRELSDVPKEDEVVGGDIIHVIKHAVHPSPMVRVFAQDRMGVMYDGIHVFIEKIVKGRPEAKGVEIRHGALDLGDAIKREERWASDLGKRRGRHA